MSDFVLEEPSYEIMLHFDSWESMQKQIEQCARICYRSEEKITEKSWERMVKILVDRGHEAMLEHASFTVLFNVDRGVQQELTRHRLASFGIESTRYVNYDKRGFRFINPEGALVLEGTLSDQNIQYFLFLWNTHCARCVEAYEKAIAMGATPQMARMFLPLGTMSKMAVTANIREWRKILSLRTPIDAHPQIREVMIPLLSDLKRKAPLLFSDL